MTRLKLPTDHLTRNATVLAMTFIMAIFVLLAPQQATADSQQAEMPSMVVVTPSENSFPETIAIFEREAKAAGWSILNRTNMAGILSARGFSLNPVMIYDVCSGEYSARILENDAYRPMSAFMPCRVSFYMTEDGGTYISRMNVQAFAPMLAPTVAEVMILSDNEISVIIEKATSK